jgi:serine/threonine protein kinase/Tfp pilus assembly protein PilF
MAADFQRVKEIFLAAVEKPGPDERRAFLEEVCGADAELRLRVEALLRRHEQAGGFLESPPSDLVPTAASGRGGAADPPGPPAAAPEAPGNRIGPYKLLQQLGEGGMGIVYLAEQEEPVKRRVALKIIKAGMDSARVLARFEQERQALAVMDHPNIAKVLDAGSTESGRPYFIMELVKGVPVTKFCDQEHLTPKERLELFIPVCQAVQHAHQKGIIHRDLKPSNVLVALYDGRPVPKVIDFGVAKATAQKLTERTMFTEVGQIVGTLEYMAPEQAELNNLDVDTRADIYSLGVLLYELLTGSPPFTGKELRSAAYTEMLRMIREVEPPKPSTKLSSSEELPAIAARRKLEPKKLTRLVRGELDWIVMKCLEKERNRRYATANGLALELERYLRDEAVEACPPSAGYRLKKLARKHKKALFTSTAFAVLLVAGSIALAWFAVRAARSELRAKADRDRALSEKVRADEQTALALAVSEFLQKDLLAQASPEQQARPDRKPDRDVKARALLDRAAARVVGKFASQPLVEAQVRGTLAGTYRELGEYAEAERHARRARELYALNLGPEQSDCLRATYSLALALRSQGRLKEARELCAETLETQRRVLGAEHPDTLRSMHGLANVLWSQGFLKEAGELHEETLAARRRVLGPEHPETLASMNNLAVVLERQRRLDEAQRLQAEALEALRRTAGAEHPDTLRSMHDLAVVLQEKGRLRDAQQLLEENLDLRRRVLGPEHHDTLRAMNDLAVVLERQGRWEEALARYEETAAFKRRVLGSDHPDTLRGAGNVANLLGQLGRVHEARKAFEETLAVQRRALGPHHPDTLRTVGNLAWLLASAESPASRDPARAIELAKEALALRPENDATWNTLGVAQYRAGDWKQAVASLEKAEELAPGKYVAHNGFFLAMAHWQLGDKARARAWYDKAVAWTEKNALGDIELRRFRAEAEALLGVKQKRP